MFSRVDEIIREGLEKRVFSGAAVGIAQSGRTLYTGYWGKTNFDADAVPVHAGTLFDLASVTKIVATTAVALRFLDRGLLRLDDRVADFFPEASTTREITIRQLLTHTSGEPPHFMLESEIQDPEGLRELLLHRPLAAPPGEVEAYSCMGYMLLGEILQSLSGLTLDRLVEREVTGPLGLRHTGYGPVAGPDVAATRDLATGTRLDGIVHDENARFQGGVSANAGLFSCVGDLLDFAKVISGAWAGRQNGYLSRAVLRAATRNYTPGLAEDRGLGFFLGSNRGSSLGDLCGDEAFGHTGFTGPSLLWVPEMELAVVFLCNRVLSPQDAAATVRLRACLHNAIIGALER
ncbi:MAG: serine hydrolase domain-containing protein [Bacillota bacterium]|nr:serine hydrolase domain-containing protein [Bacillota bacterium]